jgi:hypothetical protein
MAFPFEIPSRWPARDEGGDDPVPDFRLLSRDHGYDYIFAPQQVAEPTEEEPRVRVVGIVPDFVRVGHRLLDSGAVCRQQLRMALSDMPCPLLGPFYIFS